MENCYGQQGWREFYRNRKDILSEFDKILEKTASRPIKVAHGQGVEAYIRKWLSEFLPKKYGVTSGYIIPDIYGDSENIYHFDIIIYSRLDAPVLWTEGNEDNSEQGKYRAIPAKYVVAVYEVKSRLTKTNVTEALGKLNQTKIFSDQLHPLYSCGMIFIELKENDKNRESIIKELIKGKDVFGFSGGMVLRYEGDDTCTALIEICKIKEKNEEDNKRYKPLAKPIDGLNIYQLEDGSLQVAEDGAIVSFVKTSKTNWAVSKGYGVMFCEGTKSVHLDWSRGYFSQFCINLLSSLEGLSYNDEEKPSFGKIFDHIERKKAPLQSMEPKSGLPFLSLTLSEGGEHGEKLFIDYDDSTIKFFISAKNQSETCVVISDDSFKNQIELQEGITAIKPVILIFQGDKNLRDIINNKKGFEVPYRLIYYPVGKENDFYAIERTAKITENNIEFV